MSLFNLMETRKNPTLAVREEQLAINLLALNGGKPYIQARLSRFPAEPEVAWSGSGALGNINSGWIGDASNIHGRRDRAYNINHLARIIDKLAQHIFAVPPERDGINPAFAADVTRTRIAVNPFWKQVLRIGTACRWCWVRVDGPELPTDEEGNTVEMSVAEMRARDIRPYWSIHNPLEVVDWAFDATGGLLYTLTEGVQVRNDDPMQATVARKVRILWQPGAVTFFWYNKEGNKIERSTQAENPPDFVPFIPFGEISPTPWWVDDTELIMRTMMNLTSSSDDSMYNQMYGQMIIPRGALSHEDAGDVKLQYSEAVAGAIGTGRPIEEDEITKGITRYITPNAADLRMTPEVVQRKKMDLFEQVGFALKPETRTAMSAEAKAWDHLDVNAVLSEKAQLLEETENKLVRMTKQIDPGFDEYVAKYANTFDTGDIEKEIKALIGLTQLDMPDEVLREVSKGALNKAVKRGLLQIDSDTMRNLTELFDAEINQLGEAAPVVGDIAGLPDMTPPGDDVA